ncbi:MAG: peptide deformylase [Thermoanaerobaculum sp.]|nr:peptide deformylase [Thermoanaerobaculum sp.]
MATSPPLATGPGTSLQVTGNLGRVRQVVRLGHPVLRQRAEEVPAERFGTRKLRDLAFDLVRTMHAASGVGLAAPQIAVPWRVFAYYVPADYGEEIPPRVLVNPVLTPLATEQQEDWEGCLSVPGLRGLVPRFTQLAVEAYSVDGERVTFHAAGFHARVLQHEQDHLDGIVFLERMRSLQSLAFEAEWEQYASGKQP